MADTSAEMYSKDRASQFLGIQVTEANPDQAVATMTVTANHANGLGVCHGGFIFTLADTAMAFVANSGGPTAFATNAEIDFVNPAMVGDKLTAVCARVVERGRFAVNDVSVKNQDGLVVAVFRGRTLATQ